MAWAPHLAPPYDHLLAGGTLLRETIMLTICTPYPIAKSVRAAPVDKIVDDIAKAVITHAFVAHMTEDLSDEEIEILPHPSHFGYIRSYSPPLGHSLREPLCITCLIPPQGTPIGENARSHGSHTPTESPAPHRTSYVELALRLLVRKAALAKEVWLAIPTPLSYLRALRPLIKRLFPCNHHKALAPSSLRTICTALS